MKNETSEKLMGVLNGSIEISCPDCDHGTLGPLTKDELEKLKQTNGDGILGQYWGCDECQFYTSEDTLGIYID